MIKEQIIHSDSVAINYFKGDGTMDSVVEVASRQEPKMTKIMKELIARS